MGLHQGTYIWVEGMKEVLSDNRASFTETVGRLVMTSEMWRRNSEYRDDFGGMTVAFIKESD